MKHAKKLWLGLFSLPIIVSLLMLSNPQPVSALANGEWINPEQIRYGGVIFTDSNYYDSTIDYKGRVNDNCKGTINGFSNGNSSMFETDAPLNKATITLEGPGCTAPSDSSTKVEVFDRIIFTDEIRLANDELALALFRWADSARMQGNITGNVYEHDPSLDAPAYRIFTRTDEVQTGCPDRITAYNPGHLDEMTTFTQYDSSCNIVRQGVRFIASEQSNRGLEPDTGTLVDAPDPADGAAEDRTCEAQGGAMGWVLCPMVSMLDSVLDLVDRQIEALLEVDRNKYTNEGLRGAWETVRNISYIILIPIMLVMVIGTALGFEIFSAYTIKKALPRMVIAVIFITFSWYICQFLIGFSNVVGSGVSGLITSPFREQMPASCQQGNLSLSCLFDVPGGAGITGGILHGILLLPQYALTFIGALVILVFFGWTLLLVVGTAMLILLARQMFIIALMMLAPLAILAWIFPGNDKLWKSWWNIFTKLLMMFPLIMLILAMGKIFAHLINLTGGAGLDGAVLGPIMKLAAYMLPYAFIPFAFKFAGGVFANVAGIINDKEKGLFDRARKGRAAKFGRWQNQKAIKNAPAHSLRGRLNTLAAVGTNINKAGLRPGRWRANMSTTLGSNARQEIERNQKENADYATWQGNDTLNAFASMSRSEAELRQLLTQHGVYNDPEEMEKDIARVEKVRKAMSSRAFRQMTFLAATAGGTTYDRKLTNHHTGEKYILNWIGAMATAAGNDDADLAYLTAQGKSSAMSAGRIDQGGASFNTIFEQARLVRQGGTTGEEAARVIHQNVVESQGAQSLAHASIKPYAVENLVPALRQRLVAAAQSGNQDAYDRELALFANIYDSMSHTAPNKAEILADQIMRWDPNTGVEFKLNADTAGHDPRVASPTTGPTIQQLLESRRSSQVFRSTRREYGVPEELRGGGLPPDDPGAGTAGSGH